jgi:hypothetical protein
MRIDVDRWLAVLAFATGAFFCACTVEPATSGLGTGVGTGGGGTRSSSSSGSSGKGGSGGLAGSAGSGGSAGSVSDGGTEDVSEAGPTDAGDGGHASDASDAGQLACFAEDADAGDAGADECGSLPYWNVLCSLEAGVQKPQGLVVCLAYQSTPLKQSAFRQVIDCLKALPVVSPCSQAHTDAANLCSAQLYTHDACTTAPVTFDGASYGCPQIAASCPGTDGGVGAITETRCNSRLDPWTAEARRRAIECYLDPSSPGDSCFDKFDKCIPFPNLPSTP